MTSYSAPLKRFRLVVALGVVAGAALALTSAYRVDFSSIPPELTAREQPRYTAGTQLEVASPNEPYYRTSVDVPIVTPATGDDDAPVTNLAEQEEPSTRTLVAAANYYPHVIEGDAVAALRDRLFGKIEGEITADAIGARTTPNRIELGQLPFIQVIATADTPQQAIQLAENTAQAFIRYVRNQQQSGGIRPAQRISIRQLRKPERTFAVGGTSPMLPMLILVALVAVACGAAFLLDRLFPRRPRSEDRSEVSLVKDDRDQLVAASGREA